MQVNEDMSGFAVGAGTGQSAAIHHTLQRHTEILQDYRQEFNKTAFNIAAIVEREDLLRWGQYDGLQNYLQLIILLLSTMFFSLQVL